MLSKNKIIKRVNDKIIQLSFLDKLMFLVIIYSTKIKKIKYRNTNTTVACWKLLGIQN